MTDDNRILSFSMTNGIGPDMNNVPLLLRRFADELEKDEPLHVCDLVHHMDVEAEGYLHSLTVYYTKDPRDIEAGKPDQSSKHDGDGEHERVESI
jgi:hypothetical protein